MQVTVPDIGENKLALPVRNMAVGSRRVRAQLVLCGTQVDVALIDWVNLQLTSAAELDHQPHLTRDLQ